MDARFAIVVAGGAADEPTPSLEGRTPLEAATMPHCDALVASGRIGTVRTAPAELLPGSDVAMMALLGYDPRQFYTGRAPIEAAARGVAIGRDEVAFRCNLVHAAGGEMRDPTTGHIGAEESAQLFESVAHELQDDVTLEAARPRLHGGLSYRGLLVLADAETHGASCAPPHEILGERIGDYLPKGRGSRVLRDIMERARSVLADHPVNLVRAQRGLATATDLWLWGQGVPPLLPRFRQRFGKRGAIVAAVDAVRGIGKLLGLSILDVAGATGGLDTDYGAKGRAAAHALDEYDLVVVHVEAPHAAAHAGDAAAKVGALEAIDELVVGPLVEKLRWFDRWRILVAADHTAPVRTRMHTSAAPPFAIAGTDVPQNLSGARAFCEPAATTSDFHVAEGHELMDYLLRL